MNPKELSTCFCLNNTCKNVQMQANPHGAEQLNFLRRLKNITIIAIIVIKEELHSPENINLP